MEQGELLPEGQVLEREVGAGSERRAQGAQRSDHEEHCRHGSHAAGSSSSLGTGFWQTTEPNQLSQSDIFTFLLRRHERIYLTAFMDDHSRFIVSHAMARQQKSALVMEALEKGIAKYGPQRLENAE